MSEPNKQIYQKCSATMCWLITKLKFRGLHSGTSLKKWRDIAKEQNKRTEKTAVSNAAKDV